MKYKLICGAVIIGFLASATLLTNMQSGLGATRTHQHLEAQQKEETEKDASEFSTHLPIVQLVVDESQLTFTAETYANGYLYAKKNAAQGQVRVMDSERYRNHLSDAPAVDCAAEIRLRGSSSVYYDKHSYKITFLHADKTENKDVSLLGMEPYDEWALHGPFLDRSLMRNYLCMNISGQLLPDTPDVRFCELFLNGAYQGVYVAMETVARAKGRVEIDAYEDDASVSSYIIRQDRYTEGPQRLNVFGSYTYALMGTVTMDVIYPGERLTEEVRTYIERDFSRFEKALYSYDYDDPALGYRHYIDMDSFIDYAIISEFFRNDDTGTYSTYFYRDTRGKIHIGPVWDFNSALDNYDEPVRDNPGFSTLLAPHYSMLVKDEYFVNALIRRYHQLRKTVLSEEYLLSYIDATAAYLGDAAARNFETWGYTLNAATMPELIALEPDDRNPGSFEAAVQNLKDFIVWRGAWLDAHIESLRQNCHESAVKQFNP